MNKSLIPVTRATRLLALLFILAFITACAVNQQATNLEPAITTPPVQAEPATVCATPEANWGSCFTPTPPPFQTVSLQKIESWDTPVRSHPQLSDEYNLPLNQVQGRVTYPLLVPTLLPQGYQFVGAKIGTEIFYPATELGVEMFWALDNDGYSSILFFSQVPAPTAVDNFAPHEYEEERGVRIEPISIGQWQGHYRWDEQAHNGTLRWQADGYRFTLAASGVDPSSPELWLVEVAQSLESNPQSVTAEQDQDEPSLSHTQYGVTLTVESAQFDPERTYIDFLAQVDPVWQMDASASAFPPQQALIYPTFPDSLVDDEGQPIAPLGWVGERPSVTPHTSGLQQLSHQQWAEVAPETRTVTATVTVNLSSLHRQIEIPIDWANRQEGDVWEVDVPLVLGYTTAVVQQIEWKNSHPDGRARLIFSVAMDEAAPQDIRLYCLHLAVEDPWRNDCANFEGEKSYTILLQPNDPIALHLRASLEFLTPFLFVLPTE